VGLERTVVRRLAAARGWGESYSDVILERLHALRFGHGRPFFEIRKTTVRLRNLVKPASGDSSRRRRRRRVICPDPRKAGSDGGALSDL